MGYGYIGRGGRGVSVALAHRVSWEIHFGRIPEGMVVCHACDVTSCCRPNHLFLGTQKNNSQDAVQKHRMACGKRHYRTRIDELVVIAIRNRVSAGESRSAVARAYGIGRTAVQKIVCGSNWKHVPMPRKEVP